MHPDTRLGTSIAGYRLERVLGRGGMGVVYLAEDIRLGRKVAIKVLAPEHGAEPDLRMRFLGESRLAAAIDHPNILPVFEAGEEDGVVFIAMRYVSSGDLRDLLLRGGRLDTERALHLLDQVANALDAAHRQGLVHRDVKPGNILIAQDSTATPDHAYLSDFGLTRDSGAETELTDPLRIIGTLDYLAPEQIRGNAVDARADQYALGCLLFQALSGVAPFAGTDVAVLWAHVHHAPPSLREHRPDLARELDPVIDRAMAKDPGRRFATCAELIATARTAIDPESHRPGERRRRRTQWLLVAASLLIALASAGMYVRSMGQQPPAAVRVVPNSVAALDPRTSTVIADIPVGTTPSDVVAGAGYVWVINTANSTVSRIDPRTQTAAGPAFGVGAVPGALAAGAGQLWVADARHDAVIRVDAQSETPTPPIPIRAGSSPNRTPTGSVNELTVSGNDVYAESVAGLARINGIRGRVERIRRSGIYAGNPYGPSLSKAVVVGEGGVWVETYNGISHLKPRTLGKIGTLTGPNPPGGIAAGNGWVWVADAGEDTLWRIDPRYDGVDHTFKVHGTPTGVAVGDGWIWTAASDGTVTRMDPDGNRRKTIRIGATPTSITYADGLLWVSVA